jgi:hypothetical protein
MYVVFTTDIEKNMVKRESRFKKDGGGFLWGGRGDFRRYCGSDADDFNGRYSQFWRSGCWGSDVQETRRAVKSLFS